MEIKYLSRVVSKKDIADISKLLADCDEEFLPPLSQRTGTRQLAFGNEKNNHTNITEYLGDLLRQHTIFYKDNDHIIAFLSYIHNYKINGPFSAYINANDINNYITTICVAPNYRKQGLANNMYDYLETIICNEDYYTCVSTRTWSTNISHINLLKKRNYTMIKVIENDRKCNGVSLDTVYFLKRI